MTFIPKLFEQAREKATVESVAGIKLYRDGADWRGECPLCGASEKSKAGGAFWANYAQTHWMCFACQEDKPEDVIELERRLRAGAGDSPREAALRILGMTETPSDAARRDKIRAEAEDPAEAERKRLARLQLALRFWKQGLPAGGTLVETYLRSCGLWGWHLQQALMQVRFHPRAYHSGEGKTVITAPAMVGLLMTPFGPTGGVHVTYLAADGADKAALDPPRRRWGPGTRLDAAGVAHPGAVWLSSPKGPGPVIVGEGIETTGAAGVLYRAECRMVAALALGPLAGSLLKNRMNLVDPAGLVLDPDRPAFVWPGVNRVIACIDRDMSTIYRRTVASPNERVPFDADYRAQLCARMVDAAWRVGGAEVVEFAVPPRGLDMRDQLKRAPKSPIQIEPLQFFYAG